MGNCYMLIAVSVLASLSSSHGSQVITSFGKTATLQCQIANLYSDLRFHWEKDGTIIYFQGSSGEHTNMKYSVTDTASLAIHDVMDSDAGNYSCIVVRKSFATVKSDIMQLYVIDVSVSHCKDNGQEVDGCSCNINGSNITSLQCFESGFPHPPVVTWEEEDRIIYLSSSVDLTRFSENITLTCKARDENLKRVVANKTVCVYYAREETSTGGSPVETTTACVNDQARVAAIVVSIILILVFLGWLISCLAAAYIHNKGEAFHLPRILKWTSMVVGDKQQLSSVGLVLLNDLRSAPEETKESIKAAVVVVALVVDPNKIHRSHVDPNVTIHSLFIDMNETLQRSLKTGDLGDPDATFDLDRILDERDRDECEMLITNPDFQEVTDESQVPTYQGSRVIHQSLSMPANMTSPMTSSMVPWNPLPSVLCGELHSSERAVICNNATSRIILNYIREHSGLRGNRCMNCSTAMLTSLSMPANMTSSMTSSMVAFNPLSSVLRGELQSSERAAIYNNAISRIILDILGTGHSSIRVNSCLDCSTAMLTCTDVSSYTYDVVDDDVSRSVAFWTSKMDKLASEVNNVIEKSLFPLKTTNTNKSSVSDPVVQTRQEADEIPYTPSTAKLLEDKSRDSEESNNDHHDFMIT